VSISSFVDTYSRVAAYKFYAVKAAITTADFLQINSFFYLVINNIEHSKTKARYLQTN